MEYPFERAAMRGEEMPSGLGEEEQQLFLSLRLLYYQLSIGLIDRRTGTAEKKKLVRVYEDAKRVHAFGDRCRDHSVRMWRELEGLKSKFRKKPSVELGMALVEALDGKYKAVVDVGVVKK